MSLSVFIPLDDETALKVTSYGLTIAVVFVSPYIIRPS